MSNQQVATALLNDIPPRFPKLTKTLNKLFDQREGCFCGESLSEIGNSIKGFNGLERCISSDNYFWFWILKFTINNEDVKIAIPWRQDTKKIDNTRLDRSIAVYANNNISDIQLEQLINNLLMELSNF